MKTKRATVGTFRYFVRYHGLIRGTMFYIMIILLSLALRRKQR